jgi:hypothetical protein
MDFLIIIDTNIFDGMITPRIHKGMVNIERKKRELSDPVIDASPTLVTEMKDLNRILQKGHGGKTRIIKDLVQYPSLVNPDQMSTLEYDIKAHTEDFA